HRDWNLRLGLDHASAVLGDLGLHLLLRRRRLRQADFGLGLRHARVGLGLVDLQPGADVLADFDIGDVDRDDLEGRVGVEPAGQHRLGNAVGIAHHDHVALGRTDRGYDAFADAGDDRFFRGPAYQLLQVGAHRDPRADFELDSVFGHRAERRAFGLGRIGTIDDFGVDAGLHGPQNVAARQVDGGGPIEFQIDVGAVRGDDRLDDPRHVAAGQIVGFQAARRDPGDRVGADAGLHGHDFRLHDQAGVDLPQAHPDQAEQAD